MITTPSQVEAVRTVPEAWDDRSLTRRVGQAIRRLGDPERWSPRVLAAVFGLSGLEVALVAVLEAFRARGLVVPVVALVVLAKIGALVLVMVLLLGWMSRSRVARQTSAAFLALTVLPEVCARLGLTEVAMPWQRALAALVLFVGAWRLLRVARAASNASTE